MYQTHLSSPGTPVSLGVPFCRGWKQEGGGVLWCHHTTFCSLAKTCPCAEGFSDVVVSVDRGTSARATRRGWSVAEGAEELRRRQCKAMLCVEQCCAGQERPQPGSVGTRQHLSASGSEGFPSYSAPQLSGDNGGQPKCCRLVRNRRICLADGCKSSSLGRIEMVKTHLPSLT